MKKRKRTVGSGSPGRVSNSFSITLGEKLDLDFKLQFYALNPAYSEADLLAWINTLPQNHKQYIWLAIGRVNDSPEPEF